MLVVEPGATANRIGYVGLLLAQKTSKSDTNSIHPTPPHLTTGSTFMPEGVGNTFIDRPTQPYPEAFPALGPCREGGKVVTLLPSPPCQQGAHDAKGPPRIWPTPTPSTLRADVGHIRTTPYLMQSHCHTVFNPRILGCVPVSPKVRAKNYPQTQNFHSGPI